MNACWLAERRSEAADIARRALDELKRARHDSAYLLDVERTDAVVAMAQLVVELNGAIAEITRVYPESNTTNQPTK